MSQENTQSQSDSVNAGRILMVLIATSLIAMGILFIWLMGRSYLRAKEMRDWPVAECIILESSIEERQHDPYSPIEYSHAILYGYEWQGEALTGDRVSLRGTKWSSKRHAIDASFQLYPVGSTQKCHINPQNPALTVLEMDSLAPLYSIWFPALFMVGGVGILISVLRPSPKA